MHNIDTYKINVENNMITTTKPFAEHKILVDKK